MTVDARPTIVALSSGAVPSGVAVYRVSGPAARAVAATVAGPVPPPRRASLRWFRDPGSGERLDRGLVLWLPAPGSFTGEDSAELHGHGGPAVVAATLDAILAVPGTRLAEPGEFARRAFESGTLDLTAAEGLGDLVAAETQGQRRQALRQMEGALGRLYDGWRASLVRALAHAEAFLDFPDEEMPDEQRRAIASEVASVRREMDAHLADRGRGERIRAGISIAILGAPNVGKSSLLNRLAARDAAITAASPGTTRDVVEVRMEIGGNLISLLDTAGLREAADPVEVEGVRRAREAAARADLRLVVVTPEDPLQPPELGSVAGDMILVVNKIDLARDGAFFDPAIGVSALTGAGIGRLVEAIGGSIKDMIGVGEAPALTRRRHREAIASAAAALRRFEDGGPDELGAEDLRIAARSLGRATGAVDVEDLLDIIFRDFCIGK